MVIKKRLELIEISREWVVDVFIMWTAGIFKITFQICKQKVDLTEDYVDAIGWRLAIHFVRNRIGFLPLGFSNDFFFFLINLILNKKIQISLVKAKHIKMIL